MNAELMLLRGLSFLGGRILDKPFTKQEMGFKREQRAVESRGIACCKQNYIQCLEEDEMRSSQKELLA